MKRVIVALALVAILIMVVEPKTKDITGFYVKPSTYSSMHVEPSTVTVTTIGAGGGGAGSYTTAPGTVTYCVGSACQTMTGLK